LEDRRYLEQLNMLSDKDYSSLFQWLESISSLKTFKARLSELKQLYDHTEASIQKLGKLVSYIDNNKQKTEDGLTQLQAAQDAFASFQASETKRLEAEDRRLFEVESSLISLKEKQEARIREILDTTAKHEADISKREKAVVEAETNLKAQFERVWADRADLRTRLHLLRTAEKELKEKQKACSVKSENSSAALGF
jgi:chromosome segregation ATPase